MFVECDSEVRAYSDIEPEKRDFNLRELINSFSREFKVYDDLVSYRGRWKDKMDRICLVDPQRRRVRETMIAYLEDNPAGMWQFCQDTEESEAYGEGAFILPEYRGMGIGFSLLGGVIERLSLNGKRNFFVGYEEKNKFSGKIRKNKLSQKFAQKVVERLNDAVIEVRRGGRLIRGYAIDTHLAREIL